MNNTNDADIPNAGLDRGKAENFRQYLLDNPVYCRDILGIVPTQDNIDQYIMENLHLFKDDPKKLKAQRRRL